MSDWQPGDLALCVRDFGGTSSKHGQCPVSMPDKGNVYHVTEVFIHPYNGGKLALRFSDLPDLGPGTGWNAKKFLKITPPEADSFDREIIDLMAGKPVPVEV